MNQQEEFHKELDAYGYDGSALLAIIEITERELAEAENMMEQHKKEAREYEEWVAHAHLTREQIITLLLQEGFFRAREEVPGKNTGTRVLREFLAGQRERELITSYHYAYLDRLRAILALARGEVKSTWR